MKREFPSRKSGTKRDEMYTADDAVMEMRGLAERLAEPYHPGEHWKETVGRVAKNAKISWRQAKAYWYGERKIIPLHVYRRFEKAVIEHERRQDEIQAQQRANRARLHQLTHHSSDQEFYQVRAAEAYIDPGQDGRTARQEVAPSVTALAEDR